MELFKSRARVVYTNAVGDKVYPVVVDIKKGIKSTEEVTFVSSDINTGILSVAFVQGNEVYNVSGAEVVCSVMRPDASTLEIPCEVVSGNIVEVPLGVNGTSQDGVYSIDFKIFKGGNKVVGTPIMNYSVSLSIGNDMVVEEDDRLPILTMLMTQVGTLKEEATSVISQANDTIELARVATNNAVDATNNAVDATNNANATIERVSQEVVEVIEEVEARANDTITTMVNTANEKVVEMDTAKIGMTNTVSNKVNEIETRFNALTSSQQQSSEVIDARDGEVSLKARLDRDIEKAKQVYVNVEGSNISTDSSSGYAKDVEILGNTIQDASNLADIRSVGDKVEGQELYEIPVLSYGKNLFNKIFKAELEKCNIATVSEQGVVTLNGTLSTHYMFNVVIPKGKYRATTFSDSRMALHVFWDGGDNGFQTNNTLSYTEDRTLQCYIASGTYDNHICKFQIEEGTVATPYEPYIEDKLTILSPVQLEKIGDVADRIICKDGVWGVEKNIKTTTLKQLSRYKEGENVYVFHSVEFVDYVAASPIMCNTVPTGGLHTDDTVGISGTTSHMYIRIPKTDVISYSIEGVNDYISRKQPFVKYQTTEPIFIPLPHDQQVKLRTFAGQTNIHFETEIQGTIKAQVPKSIGATVNTHTEQIGNLSKELDRVKKLEESTVSTVTTESDFTTVEETANGYFEDIKLEGKTLVNICPKPSASTGDGNHLNNVIISGNVVEITVEEGHYTGVSFIQKSPHMKPNTTYTIVVNILENTMTKGSIAIIEANPDTSFTGTSIPLGYKGLFIEKTTTKSTYTLPRIQSMTTTTCKTGEKIKFSLMILEGDHTQNPPSYFEGLKSVGDATDEIIVSSVGVCMFDDISNPHDIKPIYPLGSNDIYWDEFKQYITHFNNVSSYENCNNLYDYYYTSDDNIWVNLGSFDKAKALINLNYKISEINNKANKKRLLYYNNETQTWEKPILRHWDSIEKHSDGKYYYHKRSGEVVLNGSENWGYANSLDITKPKYFIYSNPSLISKNMNVGFCDKFTYKNPYDFYENCACIATNGSVRIRYNGYNDNLDGFKAWLQANPTTVVYQLKQEEVYECTNIDLITYENETNYVVSCGAIAPKSTLKVHNNISNVVKILQEKVSVLESNVKASQEVQDMMILESDMRILELEMALMPMSIELNIGGNPMLRSATYYNFIKRHIESETYSKEYLENVMNKYLATNRLTEAEYDELYKILYPPVYDIELPIEL